MTLTLMLLLKSLLVFALSGAALLCLRRASASARHLVCLLTLSALLALPLFSLTLPGWHVAGLSTSDSLSGNGNVGALRDAPFVPNVSAPPALKRKMQDAGSQKTAGQEGAASSAPTITGTQTSFWPLLLFALYLLGVVLAGLRPLLGLWGIAHLRRACAAVTDTPTLSVSADCAAALRLAHLPLLCRADVPVPMTWGGRRPVVLLPSGPVAWPEDRLRSVLLHEMAHIKRRDWTCHRLADLACALYWFHPLVWLTARRLRAESEVACDDLVISSGITAPDYARHLLEIAGALSHPLPSQSTAIAMAQTPHIKRRITMILDETQSRRILTRRALFVALVPSAAALLTLAALRPSVKAQAAPAMTAAAAGSTSGSVTLPNGDIITLPKGSPPLNFRFSHATSVQTGYAAGPGQVSLVTTSPDLTINGTTLFAGMTDADKPGSPWWSATGALLVAPVYDANAYHAENHAGSSTHNVSFAFRLPSDIVGSTFQYRIAGCTQSSSEGFWVTKTDGRNLRSEAQLFPQTQGTRVVTAAFPPSLAKTTVQIGIASGPWKTVAQETFAHSLASPSGGTDGDPADTGSSQTTPAGTFIFSAIRPEPGNASGLTVTTTEPKQDLRIVALDAQGHLLLPSSIGGNSAAELDQITIHFAQPLSQIKEIRVETRPFQRIEFKDVALQPVK